MSNLYEGMFVLDNKVVRQGWKAAKAILTDILSKHEANTITARRWDERQLSYSIKGRGRATYVICYFELAKDAGPALNRSLELNEAVLRYLITRVDAVPATEADLAAREELDDFVVPAPPVEEAPATVAAAEPEPETAKSETAKSEEVKSEEGKSEDATKVTEEAAPAEALEPVAAAATPEPAAEAVVTEEPKTEEGA